MRLKISLALSAMVAASLSGCSYMPYQGGFLYSQHTIPLAVRDNATACNKKGESTEMNILGLVAQGDSSIDAAKRAGGITKVGSVDTSYTSILGLYGQTTTIVCGE